MTKLLELRGVSAGYDGVAVLRSVDIDVEPGQILAVLGPNGAGKTTMLRVLGGLHRPTTGDLVVAGEVRTGIAPERLARAGVCTIPEGRGIFPNLTVVENLWMMTHRGLSRADVVERAFTAFPRLAERRSQLAGSMSGGEQQMLAMARAITTDPVVLLLDELSMGLAPKIVEQLYETVGAIAETGVAVVVVEQFVRNVLRVADHAAVLVAGEIVLTGTPAAVADGLHAAYLHGTAPTVHPAPTLLPRPSEVST